MATLPSLPRHTLGSERDGEALLAYFRARAQRRAATLAVLAACAVLAVALSLLTGCASAPPSTLQRGALTAPPPAPLRPGVGAPVVGQPGAQRAPLPRSPNTRQLPPSTEPGLWAADSPRAAGQFGFAPVRLLGVDLPTPLFVPEEQLAVTVCAGTVELWLQHAKLKAAAEKLSRPERECAAHALLVLCLTEMEKDSQAHEAHKTGAPNALFPAASQRDERCRAAGANTPAVHTLLNKYQVSAGKGGAQ
jgi:hypothetical protein